MQADYISYVRNKVRRHSINVLSLNAILGALALLASLPSSVEQEDINQRRQFAAFWLIPAISVFAMLLATLKCSQLRKEQMTEMITLIYIVTSSMLLLAINAGYILENVSHEMRKQQIFLWWIAYFFTVNFMGVSYIPHLAMRMFFTVVLVLLVLYRFSLGDEVDVMSSLLIAFVLNAISEVNLYLNYKARAYLFFEMKVNEK